MVYDLGSYPVGVQNNLLSTVHVYSLGTLFLGLIFDVVLLLFVVVSVLLIYSLLMITVNEKAFDSGLMRLMGLSKKGYICSILFQALLFVLPSILCAYICSYPALFYIFKWMFKGKATEYNVTYIPSLGATAFSLVIGFAIPLVSAIIPIRIALSRCLIDSLDTARSKIKGLNITVGGEESNSGKIIAGTLLVLYGVVVFYFLPYSVLQLDLSLLLGIFLAILIGMICGLTMVAYNFERIIEIFLVHLIFFWESKAVKILVLKNLVAHREKNQLTAIIQSLTLACIIFLITMLNLEVRQIAGYNLT